MIIPLGCPFLFVFCFFQMVYKTDTIQCINLNTVYGILVCWCDTPYYAVSFFCYVFSNTVSWVLIFLLLISIGLSCFIYLSLPLAISYLTFSTMSFIFTFNEYTFTLDLLMTKLITVKTTKVKECVCVCAYVCTG